MTQFTSVGRKSSVNSRVVTLLKGYKYPSERLWLPS